MKWLLGVTLFIGFFIPALPAYAQLDPGALSEHVQSFSSDIALEQNGSLKIQETIIYTTPVEKHGIYRYIPYHYSRSGVSITAKVHSISVVDEKGNPIPFTASRGGGNLTLKIGDKDITFTGTKTYVISYIVDDVLLLDDSNPRLLWDITGEGWQFPILSSQATLRSPFATIQKVSCYGGVIGGDDGKCAITESVDASAAWDYPQTIEYGSNMTVDVQFSSENALQLPTPAQRQAKRIRENVWIGVLPVPLVALFIVWYKKGRDYVYIRHNVFDHGDRETMLKPLFSRYPPPLVYEPLDITPGLAGAILDEKYDTQDLVADILDLARKKYLVIEQTQEKTLFTSADYSFQKLKEGDKRLPAHQKLILDSIFGSSDQVKLSTLKGTFYMKIPKIQEKAFASLFQDTLFTRDPSAFQKKVALWTVAAVILGFLIAKLSSLWLPMLGDFTQEQVFIFVAVLILESVVGLFLIKNLTQKTAKGFNYMQQARGLKETIARGKWREEIKEKNLFIEEILPFAVSLGVIGKLAKDMKALKVEPPSYIHGSSLNALTTASFVNSFSRDVAGSLAYNPSSSSWSGGGSSGGGGGGGGGGSW